MAAIKKSVRLIDETVDLCGLLTKGGDVNFSGSINTIAARYNALIRENMPELTDDETLAYVCAHNGYAMSDDIVLEARRLPWTMSEAYQYDSQVTALVGDEAGKSVFLERLNGFSISQRIAILDMTQSYWSKGQKEV